MCTFDSFLDLPVPNIATLRRVLVEQHEAQGDVWLVLECSARDLRRARVDGHEVVQGPDESVAQVVWVG